MKPRDLQRLSLGDTLDLDADFGSSLAATSPLSLLSPNQAGPPGKGAVLNQGGQPVKPGPATAAAPPLPDEGEENEPVGELPQLGGARRGGRRVDPRRQSLAISQLFAGLSAGAGLLGESELAVGDEDIQVPLARSGKLLGGAANHSSLFCDPDTGDLMDSELPSPHIAGMDGSTASPTTGERRRGPDGGGALCDSPVAFRGAAGGMLCDSPILASVLRGPASTRRTPAMRASTAVFSDLHRACEEQGLDDYDGGDFQMQESNKVKELAFLFKMDGGGTPRASADASRPASSLQRTVSDGQRSSADSDVMDSIRQRLQQYQAGEGSKANAGAQQGQQAAAVVVTPQPHPAQLLRPAAPAPAHQAPGPPSEPAASAPAAGVHVAGGKPAAAPSRLPVPPARASRLRPPTTSSSFFSSGTTSSSRQPAKAATAAPARPSAAAPAGNGRAGVRPGTRGSSAAPGSVHSPAPQRAGAPRPKPAERAAAPAASAAPSARASGHSRLAQSNTRIPSPTKLPGPPAREAPAPAAQAQRGGMFTHRTLNAAAARQRPPAPRAVGGGPAAGGATRSTPAGASRVPALRLASASPGAASPANLTPNTARLRFLEQNPDLAFGGGTKLAASPAMQPGEQPAKKLTAEERHLQEWQDHL